jgi:hypothetical protein
VQLGGRARGLRSERGQALILFVGVFTVVLVVAVIVVDFGLWLAERRSVQRAADLAAAAGAQDLLVDDAAAFDNACAWAVENGYDEAQVSAAVFSKSGPAPAPSVCSGPPAITCAGICNAVKVQITKPGALLFASIFGVGGVDVEAAAVAGVTTGPEGTTSPFGGADQAIILLDAQGRMGDACDSFPAECPIENAKAAAHQLVDMIYSGGPGVRAGYAPYHNCYGPFQGPGIGCVPDQGSQSLVIGPVVNPNAVHSRIDATTSYQLQPASVCLPLWKAKQLLDAVPPEGRRVVVLLSDGGNRWQHTPTHSQHPPTECHPAATDSLQPQTTCAAARTAKGQLDTLTRQMANTLKAMNVEIYVVGLRVCGTASSTVPSASYCNGIGNGDHDNIADRRLLKCIASSKTNTNDHYIEVALGSGLPDAFQQIAEQVVSRGLIQ